MKRGEVWWANLREPIGAEPGFRRPVLIISSDDFNASRLQTVLAVSLTSNVLLADLPGNVLIVAPEANLERNSVVNITQLVTVDKGFLSEYIGTLTPATMARVSESLRFVMNL